MSVEGVIKAATEPACKLIETVSNAIGKAYEPRYTKRMADAKAYELKAVANELRNNADLPFVYNDGEVSANTTNFEDLARRAGRRIAYQEIVKQENIEAIVDMAYEETLNLENCGNEAVSREWINRFISSAGDISTEELQKIWSKVLVGEVTGPKSFSLRTLDCLRNINERDAKLFEKVCNLVISNQYILNDEQFLRDNGIVYEDLLMLDEAGLLNSSGTVVRTMKFKSTEITLIEDFGDYVLMGNGNVGQKITIPEYVLTEAGRELSHIITTVYNLNRIKRMVSIIRDSNKQIEMRLFPVISRNNEEFEYDDKNEIII